MKYTEEDLRKAFQAGEKYMNDDNASCGIESNELNEDEYIESLKLSVVEEDKISFTYSFLRRELDWHKFCELTGTNEGAEFKDNDIYYITESKAKEFNLI